MIALTQKLLCVAFQRIEYLFSQVFDDDWNPFYHLGTLGFFFFWIVVATGLYLYFFFETSISGAYQSVEYLTHEQWYISGVMRSLHRYGSDAMAVAVSLHLLREFALGRFNGARWFSWVSGIPLLWLLFAASIGGYWLVWDQLAQYIAVVTTEWLDSLPTFGDPLARNFLSDQTLSDRFFSLLVFLHIGIPLVLLLGMFIHINRIASAKTNPPLGLAVGTTAAFVILSLIKPAVSAGPADLSQLQTELPFDWFFITAYPLIETWGAIPVWLLLAGGSAILIILPWVLNPKPHTKPAVVDPDYCNGCGWCEQDCPYSAIEYTPHTHPQYKRMVRVIEDKCTACGICMGACPTHLDKTSGQTKSGIGLPDFNPEHLQQKIHAHLNKLRGSKTVLVFGCDHSVDVRLIQAEGVTCISLPCTGMLPPSFVDMLLKEQRVGGVFITGCNHNDCYFRSGSEWTSQRINGQRMPKLRTNLSKSDAKLCLHWESATQQDALVEKILTFQQSLNSPPIPSTSKQTRHVRHYAAQALFYSFFVFFIGFFATSPAYTQIPVGHAVVKLSLRHTSQLIGECQTLSEEALARLPANMRHAELCPRERSPVDIQLLINDEEVLHETIIPSGFQKDGRANFYRRFTMPKGQYTLTVRMRDNVELAHFNYASVHALNLNEGEVLVIDFDPDSQMFSFTH